MADPLKHRFSNSSDDSPLREDPSDSEHETLPLEEPDEIIETLDPRNSQLSLFSAAGHSLTDLRYGKRRESDRRNLTHRDFFKHLVDEGTEAKKLRKIVHAALERLDGETRRAQEAERRALELAQRFKIVNEARVASQQELDRVHSELRMYKVQLDNAQREILRGSDLLKDIEAQRDSAEAAAARARSTARRLKEEQMMMKAKEEGRREGYQEGLRRGYQQARGVGLEGQQFDVPPAGLAPLSSLVGDTAGMARADQLGRTDPLDGLTVMNLTTPAPGSIPLGTSFGGALQDGAGAQGSRFREIIGSPSTLRSAPLGTALQSDNPSGWPVAEDDDTRYTHPILVHNAPASPQHADYAIPPDSYIPTMGKDNVISIPPPHELYRQPSMSSIVPPSTVTDEPRSASTLGIPPRDYAYTRGQRSSPRSFAESLPSTTISQFDLVSSPKTATRGLRERSSGLSAIPEVSSSMEFSPGTEGRVRSTIIPEPITFPVPDDALGSDRPGMSRSRSRELNQQIADELRYSDPQLVDQWRRSTASQSHASSSRERLHTPHRPAHITTPSPLAESRNVPVATPSPHRRSHSVQSPPSDGPSYLGAGSHRRTTSSTPVSIRIEPPSGPGSSMSPSTVHHGMLSPDTSHQPLSMPPIQSVTSSTPTPDRPGSAGYIGGNVPYGYDAPYPSSQSPYYNLPPQAPVAAPPSRSTPEPIRGYPSYTSAIPGSSSSSLGRPHSRAASADYSAMSGYQDRPRTPSARPTSTQPIDRPQSARPFIPGQPGMAYPEPISGVPSVLRSPSRASSRQSLQPDPARPSSRASADRHRSLSLHAGSTPAVVARPLSGSSQIRRVPSASSVNSETSRKSGGYQHYDPSSYVDPAFLASAEDLTSMQSPNTWANTRANAAYTAGPSRLRSSSPSMSYASFRS